MHNVRPYVYSRPWVYIWFTNADTLTLGKIHELENVIQSSASAPDIIAVTEIKLTNYVRDITENDYKLNGYRFENANLADKGSTRGIAHFPLKHVRASQKVESMHIYKSKASLWISMRNNNIMSLFQYFQRGGKTQVSKPSKLCESINNLPENINGKELDSI